MLLNRGRSLAVNLLEELNERRVVRQENLTDGKVSIEEPE